MCGGSAACSAREAQKKAVLREIVRKVRVTSSPSGDYLVSWPFRLVRDFLIRVRASLKNQNTD
jgi:hypothetical protein